MRDKGVRDSEDPLISIRKTANELERLEDFGLSAVACYSQAIAATDRYAIEFNAEQVAHFRAQLQSLKQQLRDAAGPEQLKSVQASFDTELKGFQERVRGYLDQLRKDVASASAAVETFTSSFTQSGSDLEADVKQELQHLNKATASNDIDEMRNRIRTATAKITSSVEQMRSCNQLAVAQLKDEIRILHQEIQGMQRSLRAPDEEQNQARNHLHNRMSELARRGRPFSVLLAVIRNLDGLHNCHGPKVLESGVNTFKARFESKLSGSVTVERLSKDQFAAVLDIEPAGAITASRDVMLTLSAPIVELAGGAMHTLIYDVATGVIDFAPGADPREFQTKVTQLVAALAGRR
jgi:GGDEF domain-containing protein